MADVAPERTVVAFFSQISNFKIKLFTKAQGISLQTYATIRK
jgi:hypothetical protein